MVQLYAYKNNTRYELDLYETEPIKLNLQIEDIIEIDSVESAYSQTFRIPATQNNSKFFDWWYEMSTINFDITKVVKGEIHSDGLLYMRGELRLQSAYINKETDSIDLEIVFLGNTRSFATQISEIYMNQLNLNALNHPLTWKWTDVPYTTDGTLENSWNGTLLNGAIRYILADRGNVFEEDGTIQAPYADIVADTNHSRSFQSQQYPLQLRQFTPIVRVKEIIDAIFDQTDYSYTDDSFFSDISTYWPMVQNIYTDGIPEESALIDYTDFNAWITQPYGNIGDSSIFQPADFSNELSDPSNVWSLNDMKYTVGFFGNINLQVDYYFVWSADIQGGTAATLYVELVKEVAGFPQVIHSATKSSSPGQFTNSYQYSHTLTNYNVNKNEKLYLRYRFQGSVGQAAGGTDPSGTIPGTFRVTGAPSEVVVSQLLKGDVLITDFFKDILKLFKLVMAPSKNDPLKFIIKPWNDYIASGDLLDYTFKLDESKDVVVKPIFFEQSQDIEYLFQEESDYENEFYQNQNNLIFGQFFYDGQNELISDRRTIETAVIAPTQISQVSDFPKSSNFVIPKFYVHGSENNADASHDHLQHLPMRPKPRILFWNGMATINGGESWWYGVNNNLHENKTTYPRATYASEFPNTSSTLHLNWRPRESTGNIVNVLNGQGLYDAYWSEYIQSLYDKDARKFTAYFVLDSQDLRNISFDDVIHIQGNYYRVTKIYDAPLDNISSIKVDLVKLLDYQPELIDRWYRITDCTLPPDPSSTEFALYSSLWPLDPRQHSIFVDGQPTIPYRIEEVLESEPTGTIYTTYKVVDELCPNPCGDADPLAATYQATTPSEIGVADGSITVTASGGIDPYTIRLQGPNGYDQTETTSPATFTNLEEGIYNIIVSDQCGSIFTIDNIDLSPIVQTYRYELVGTTGTGTYGEYDTVNPLPMGTYVQINGTDYVINEVPPCDTGTTANQITAINTPAWGAYTRFSLLKLDGTGTWAFMWSSDLNILQTYKNGDVVEVNGIVGMISSLSARHNQFGTQVSTIAPGTSTVSATRSYNVFPCREVGLAYPPCTAGEIAEFTSTTPLTNGQAVKLDGITSCYYVYDFYGTGGTYPGSIPVTNVYNDCDSCS